MLNVKSALAALLAATLLAACGSTPTKESTGEYIDDAAITTKVKAAFVKDELVSALDVKVATFKGRVQLSGFADSPTAIRRADSIARTVPGVKSVDNDLRVKSH
jgi:osmotically-inducible protein OsmY